MPFRALYASAVPADRFALCRAFHGLGWRLETVPGIAPALFALRRHALPVLVCAPELPDGDWRRMLEQAAQLPRPPRLVVAARLADERLWSEVLHLGAFDVLSIPFSTREISHVISHASNSWHREWFPESTAISRAAAL